MQQVVTSVHGNQGGNIIGELIIECLIALFCEFWLGRKSVSNSDFVLSLYVCDFLSMWLVCTILSFFFFVIKI